MQYDGLVYDERRYRSILHTKNGALDYVLFCCGVGYSFRPAK